MALLNLHLSDAFIQSNLQCIQAIHFLSVCVFPRNWTHNILRCWRNVLPLSHRNSGSVVDDAESVDLSSDRPILTFITDTDIDYLKFI